MSGQAVIVDQGFEPYQGPRTPLRTRPLVICAGQLKLAWKDVWLKRLLWMSAMPAVVLAVLQVIGARLGGMTSVFNIWEIYWGLQTFFALLISYFIGRRAVGEDLHSGAFTVYLSRPVSLTGYAIGKWLAVALGVTAITVPPGWLLALLRYFSESNASFLRLLQELEGLLVGGLILAASFSLVMLAISSLTRRARACGVLWLGVVFGSAMLAEAASGASGFSFPRGLALAEGNVRFTLWLLGREHDGVLALTGLLGQVLWALLGLLVLKLRLRRFREGV